MQVQALSMLQYSPSTQFVGNKMMEIFHKILLHVPAINTIFMSLSHTLRNAFEIQMWAGKKLPGRLFIGDWMSTMTNVSHHLLGFTGGRHTFKCLPPYAWAFAWHFILLSGLAFCRQFAFWSSVFIGSANEGDLLPTMLAFQSESRCHAWDAMMSEGRKNHLCVWYNLFKIIISSREA